MPKLKAKVKATLRLTRAIPNRTVVTRCDAVKGPYEHKSALEEVSFLFIPFDAAGKFYKANAKHGVVGLEMRVTGVKPKTLVKAGSGDHYLPGPDIGTMLPEIVKQEVESVRKIHHPDTHFDESFEALARSAGKDPSSLSELEQRKMTMSLKGYEDYPTVIFLSENPTKAPFPDRIDTGIPNKGYVKKNALDAAAVKGIKPVNEMAVYVREDIDQRMASTSGEKDALYLKTERVTRETGTPLTESKDEYMLKVTLGRRGGPSLTAAGVHLRATLTNASAKKQKQELKDLQEFCGKNGIQLLMGDFNMDLQKSAQGSRGVVADHRPRFVIGEHSTEAHPEIVQQFSNSTGKAHYMGLYQADTWTMGMVGPSMYGPMGASGSRSLQGGGKYYSDHPSIYVAVEARDRGEQATAVKRDRSQIDGDDMDVDDRDPKRARSPGDEDVEMGEG